MQASTTCINRQRVSMDGMEVVSLPKDEVEMAKFLSRERSPIAVQITVTDTFIHYQGGKQDTVTVQNTYSSGQSNPVQYGNP